MSLGFLKTLINKQGRDDFLKKKTWLLSAGSLTAAALVGYHFCQNHKHEDHQTNYYQKQNYIVATVPNNNNQKRKDQSEKYITVTAPNNIDTSKLVLNEKNFNSFAPLFVYRFLQYCVLAHCNIIVSGKTGTGKTELQKLLISNIPYQDKIIIIRDKLFSDEGIYDWLTKGNGKTGGVSITDHIANTLRNNPKWVMVSETRGSEAWKMFQAVMSGHSLITTLHSANNKDVPRRFIGMCSMGYHLQEDSVEKKFLRYMHLSVHIRKKIINGFVYRYCDELAEFVPKSEKYPNGINPLFTQFINLDSEGKIHRHWKVGQPTDKLKDQIKIEINRNIAMPKGHTEFVDEIMNDQHQKAFDEK